MLISMGLWDIMIHMYKDNSFFSREKELPQAGFEPAMFCVLGGCSTNQAIEAAQLGRPNL